MAATTAQQSLEVFTNGTKAWFTDEKEGWVSATLTSKSVDGDKIKLLFRDDNDDKVSFGWWAISFVPANIEDVWISRWRPNDPASTPQSALLIPALFRRMSKYVQHLKQVKLPFLQSLRTDAGTIYLDFWIATY